MKKKLLSVVSVVLLLCSILAIPACALEVEPDEPAPPVEPVEPYYYMPEFWCSLSISYGQATCWSRLSVTPSSSKFYYYMSLQRYENGQWLTVQSWVNNGTGSASILGYSIVTHGYYYRTMAVATVYSASGTFLDSGIAYSSSYVYY